jgi:hypothetical protein
LGAKTYSLLFVPEGVNNIFFALNGVTITTEGNLPIVDGDALAKITFKTFRHANLIEDVVKFEEFLAA